MVEPTVDVKPAEPVNPASAGQPLPGQPEPEVTGASSNPDVNEDKDKQVPLAALHEERDKRQSLQAELDALRQIAGNNILFDMNGRPVQAAPQNNTQQPYPGQADAFRQKLDKAWEDDPREAVEMTVGAALQWRDEIEGTVDDQIQEVAGKHDDFDSYQTDVRKYIRALPMNQRANPGVAEMAYFVVKGQKSGNVYTRAQQEMLEKIRKGEQVGGLNPGTVSTPAAAKGVQLSEDQLKAANMMGLTPDQYKSAMK